MKVVNVSGGQASLACSVDELHILHQALNEVCNGIEVFEFETRIGADRTTVAALMEGIGAAIERAKTS